MNFSRLSSFIFLVLLSEICLALDSGGEENVLNPRAVMAKRAVAKDVSRGAPGLPGRDGRDGRDAGMFGPPGKPGKPGPRGNRGLKGNSGGVTGGAVYTRWGRKSCPTTSQTTKLYSGAMGGSSHSHHGGGSNYLCLPFDPIYEKSKPGHQSTYIYGTEYEISTQRNIFPNDLHNHDAPCAVCHSKARGSHVMIPARNVCPSGWTMEYKGYLMAGHHSHKGRTEFICVDGNPTATLGTHVSKDGALLYFVEGVCGSLPCGPYKNGHELTCVVCTK